VVIVTHDLTTLLTVCDRIAVLVDGELTVGTVDKLARSHDPWIRDFLHGERAQGAMNARRSSHGIR
jgi:phospholipid/cholesterol/gamma-HCH transport system ATP-binding protein